MLRPGDPDNYYEQFDLVPASLRPELAKGKVLVTNWHLFAPSPRTCEGGRAYAVVRQGRGKRRSAFARSRLGDLWDDEPILVLNDEGHHAYRPGAGGRGREADRRGEGRARGGDGLGERPGQDQRGLRRALLRRSVGHAVLHLAAAATRKARRSPGSSATSGWWTPSRAASPRFRACRRPTTPAGPIRSTSSCGSTSPRACSPARS